MFHFPYRTLAALAVAASMLPSLDAAAASPLPAPALDVPAASVKGPQTAVFAGGCFWGVAGGYRPERGGTKAASGNPGGNPQTGDTGMDTTGLTASAGLAEVRLA